MTDSSSAGRRAEVIDLDGRRRQPAAATGRKRCVGRTSDGRPCRNYAGASGHCRVHEPEGSTLASVATLEAERSRPAGAGGATAAAAEDVDVEQVITDALAFLRRRLTGDYRVDVYGFDRELTEKVLLPLARPLYQRYWRVRTVGLEHVPSDDGALIVANHAGTLPFDAIMTKLALFDEHPAHRHLRELAADLALRSPVIGPLARKTGNTLAHGDDATRLLAGGELVGVWPEGFKGIGKPYKDRYKLQRFGRGGFVEVALRTGKPIIPVAIIGSEEIYPMIANAKFLARLFGFPYFPITWQFPALGPLGMIPLPSKWLIDFGEPIETASYGPEAADDPMLVFELTDRVRDTIQQMLYRNLMGRRSIFF
jgi:1-acyl-sn-glycerol-3-phosphate acyltransferase